MTPHDIQVLNHMGSYVGKQSFLYSFGRIAPAINTNTTHCIALEESSTKCLLHFQSQYPCMAHGKPPLVMGLVCHIPVCVCIDMM